MAEREENNSKGEKHAEENHSQDNPEDKPSIIRVIDVTLCL